MEGDRKKLVFFFFCSFVVIYKYILLLKFNRELVGNVENVVCKVLVVVL